MLSLVSSVFVVLITDGKRDIEGFAADEPHLETGGVFLKFRLAGR